MSKVKETLHHEAFHLHVFVEILYREEKTKAKPHYLGKLGRTTAAEVNQECQAQSSV